MEETIVEGEVINTPVEEVTTPAKELSAEEQAILETAKAEKLRKECAAEVDAVLNKYGMTLVPTGIAVVENNK